jgi:hypothetical protein
MNRGTSGNLFQNVVILFNCNSENREKILLSPVSSDNFEISGAQNILEWLFLYDIEIDLEDKERQKQFRDKFGLEWL